MISLRLAICFWLMDVAMANGKWVAVAKWRGMHGKAVGLCTGELIAKQWIVTAEHCATRLLKHETVKVQVTFTQSSAKVKRGVTHCVSAKAAYDVDVALCKLKIPVNAFKPMRLNSDKYKTSGPHGKPVTCVGTSGGYHATGPKKLTYEGNGAHLYVSKSGGMKAGDSGGAWVHQVTDSVTNKTEVVLSGVIHGSGIAGQMSFIRAWIDRITNGTSTWVSVSGLGSMEPASIFV